MRVLSAAILNGIEGLIGCNVGFLAPILVAYFMNSSAVSILIIEPRTLSPLAPLFKIFAVIFSNFSDALVSVEQGFPRDLRHQRYCRRRVSGFR